jgi:hypothetical protein
VKHQEEDEIIVGALGSVMLYKSHINLEKPKATDRSCDVCK